MARKKRTRKSVARSQAARKGWATRLRNKRAEAARRGWEKRRRRLKPKPKLKPRRKPRPKPTPPRVREPRSWSEFFEDESWFDAPDDQDVASP